MQLPKSLAIRLPQSWLNILRPQQMLVLLLTLMISIQGYGQTQAQPGPSGSNNPMANTWFDPSKLVETGVYYYPEAWPKNQWSRDIQNIAKLGFEYIHISEFAWSTMEPTEGTYRLGWIDTVLNIAAQNKLKVILCTPTPTPPVWLSRNYPDILMVNGAGQTINHQGRTHGSWSSKRFEQYVRTITTKLGERFGKHPAVWGWQLDNEPSHYSRSDYSPNAQQHFRQWLRAKYGTIAKLNEAWGASFWSNTYNNFDQIPCPNGEENTAANPHQVLDYRRFSADACADFLRMQQQTLRQYISPRQFVTTNFMHWHSPVDPWRNQDLDAVTYTMYPVWGGDADSANSQSFRLGSIGNISWANDYYRSINGLTGVMELQPGQVNWGKYNPQPMPGAVRMWLWNAYSGGLKLICSYRYRQPRFGNELYHNGMVGPDGVTPLPGGLEFSQFMREIKQLRQQPNLKAAPPAAYTARKAAILWSPDNHWIQECQGGTKQWPGNFAHQFRYYNILKSFTAPVDYTDTLRDWSAYPFLIVPSFQLMSHQTAAKLKAYAENGGQVVISARTAQMDNRGHLWEGPWAQPILDLIGAKAIPFFDHLPVEATQAGSLKVKDYSKTYQWSTWGDIIDPKPETEVWATYQDQFYAGRPAVTHHKVGKGGITYIGVHSKTKDFEAAILQNVYQLRKVEVQQVPNELRIDWRDGHWVACNYGTRSVQLPVPTSTKFLIGQRTLKPTEVAVWQ